MIKRWKNVTSTKLKLFKATEEEKHMQPLQRKTREGKSDKEKEGE